MKNYTKICPSCKKELIYANKHSLRKSIKNNSTCKDCYQAKNRAKTTGLKTCSKCKLKKSRDEFNKNKCSADGLAYQCRGCVKNSEKIKGYTRQYVIKNKDKIKKRKRKWFLKNKEKIYAQQKEASKKYQ